MHPVNEVISVKLDFFQRYKVIKETNPAKPIRISAITTAITIMAKIWRRLKEKCCRINVK